MQLFGRFLKAVSPQYSRGNTAIQVPTRICVLSNCNFKTATPHSARCREGESHSRGLVLIIAIIVDVEKQDALMNSRPVTFVCLSLTLSSNWKRHKRKIPLDCPGDERIDNSFVFLRDAIKNLVVLGISPKYGGGGVEFLNFQNMSLKACCWP